jgi:dienelactone hydrolase
MRKRIEAFLILTILAAMPCTWSITWLPAASAEELVRFEGGPSLLDLIRQRQARERGETPVASSETIEGYLSKPDGNGPFAAIVYLHGCSGLSESTRRRIAELMTGWGYVTLAVDSFASRGIQHACDQAMPRRQGDALGALHYLSGLGFVDPDRVALVGASQGAGVALQIASTRAVRPSLIPEEPKFAAVVAYYPPCSVAAEQLAIPAIILIGKVDDWTPAGDCERWMERRAGKGAPVRLVVYPSAYHAFDNPSGMIGGRYLGHWLKYDADAAARAIGEMHDFLRAQFAK